MAASSSCKIPLLITAAATADFLFLKRNFRLKFLSISETGSVVLLVEETVIPSNERVSDDVVVKVGAEVTSNLSHN